MAFLPGSGVGIGIPTSLPNERDYIKKLENFILGTIFAFSILQIGDIYYAITVRRFFYNLAPFFSIHF
jgi:hypothetical protein